MALPLLRTADLLLTQGGLVDLLPPKAGTADGMDIADGSVAAAAELRLLALVELAKGEARSCTDVGRLMGAASLLCHAGGCGGALRAGAFAPLMVLLLNRYPKVGLCRIKGFEFAYFSENLHDHRFRDGDLFGKGSGIKCSANFYSQRSTYA